MEDFLEKINYKIIRDFFSKCGYAIIGEYKNSNTYVLCEKSDGFRCYASYSNLKAGKTPILWGKYNYSNLDYNIPLLLKKRNERFDFLGWKIITKSKRKRCLLTFKCTCGNTFNKVLEDFVYRPCNGCNSCRLEKRGYKRRKKNYKEYIESAGYRLLQDITDFRYFDFVEVVDANGYKGFISAASINSGKGMSRFDVRINKKYYIENVNNFAKQNGISATCVGFDDSKQYVRQGLKFKCSCGNEFITSIASFQNGKIRCDVCARSVSSLEYEFKKYLDGIDYKYIFQYSLNDCRDVLPLSFDFYLIEYDVLIEIDGEGHYKPCNFNQISNEDAMKTFEITKKHDNIKNNYCISHNIKLIRIPYWLFNNEKSYIEFFQKSLNE